MTFYSYILSNIYSLSPLFITLILSIVSLLPIMPSGTEEIAPLLGVISLSFWVVNRPDIMGWLSVIIIGIFNDVLYGSLLGIACLSAIIVRLILIKIVHKIDFTNIFHTLFYVGLSLIIWLFINSLAKYIIYFNFYNYYAVIFQFLVSLVISPIIIFIQLLLLKKMSI